MHSRKGTFFGLGEVLNPGLQSIKKPVAARSASAPKDCDRFMFLILCKSHADSCCSLGTGFNPQKRAFAAMAAGANVVNIPPRNVGLIKCFERGMRAEGNVAVV